MDAIDWLQRTLDGLLDAGPYALVGLGLTLGFGTLRRVNLAYGAGAMLAAYAGAWLHATYVLPVVVVMAAVVAVAAVAGFYVEWLCFPDTPQGEPAATRGTLLGASTDAREVVALAASFAVWMQLEQLSVGLLPNHLNPFPSLAAEREWTLGPLGLRPDRLLLLVLAAALVAAVTWLLRHTRTGLAWRAMASERTAARLSGLAVPRLQRVAFIATSMLAGLAACAVLSLEGQVTPMFGMWMLVKGLVAAMLGGLGSVPGVLVGAVVLGVVEAHAQAAFGPLGREAAAWALLLAVLVWRGGLRRREPVGVSHA